MESIKQSMADLTKMFETRMTDFQKSLQDGTSPSSSVSGLAAEFCTFKTFVVATLRSLQQQITLLARSHDQLDMRGRRKMLLVHGVPEQQKEDVAASLVKVVVDKLSMRSFSSTDISRSHRMGRSSNDKPRPILVKFHCSDMRDKVWFAKTLLKGSGITIAEFLTKERHDAFMAARRRFGVAKCWTRSGSIVVLAPDGSRHHITSVSELDKVPITLERTVGIGDVGGAAGGRPKRNARK